MLNISHSRTSVGMSSSLISQSLSLPFRKMEPVSSQHSDNQSMPNQKTGEMGFMQTPLLPTKRKAAAEPSSDNSLPQQLANKRMLQMETSPRFSPLNKRQTQLQPMTNPQGLSNKRMMRNESMSNKTVSPRVQTPKGKTAPMEVSPKVRNGSYEAVRSKMRETLAAALSVGNNYQNKEEVSNETDEASRSHVEVKETTPETKSQNLDNSEKTDEQKPQYNYVIPDTDGSFGDTFFAKDELLQGNGLSWAWDMEVAELKEVENNENPNLNPNPIPDSVDVGENGVQQVINDSPQELAYKVEAELFKLFGGVNKKYKEKGRSLMFNLKDRNNPELREKVLSGEISPERLCSMTPEELASKELSEWRMAKAEELDKMIVLPDSDGDMRRLVKKTHKGEYQVEVEQDDGVSVEVSVGSSSLDHFRPKKKKTSDSSSAGQEKVDNARNSLTVSTDGADIMQELIVEEFKDEGFLPPIVSLDEFMESLDSEPPFENLPGEDDAKEMKVQSEEDNSETGYEKASSAANPMEAEVHTNKILNVVKAVKSPERKVLPAFSASIGECLWEGDLQLAISSSVSVIGLFRSGEKTSTKEWPGSMEIKGRVRLQPFEKFLQELPMSRTRAVMVVHFALKDKSPEFHRASLSEAVDSYVAEERVGFGEPIPGVEVYFCPPHKRIIEMLTRLLSKDQNDILKSTDDGLIGVVVWRRPMLPNSASSHHNKHHKKNFPSRRQEDNINTNTNTNSNSNLNTSKSLRFGHNQPPQPNNNGGDDDDDDDIPPGFGPGVVAREVDDLPEFSFSGGSNSSRQTLPGSGSGSRMIQTNPHKPVEHMRQLVYEYGQTGSNTNWNGNGNGNGNRAWNRDDDDDIPEWKPQLQQLQNTNHNIQGHLVNQVRPPVMGQTMIPVMPFRPPPPPPPVNLIMQNGWVQQQQPPHVPHGLPPNAAIPGQQHYGGQWRPDDPRGRGGF